VHYPADVVTGSLVGVVVAQLTGQQLDRRFSRPPA
jgi:membrane-associated phospholipid phosphatase